MKVTHLNTCLEMYILVYNETLNVTKYIALCCIKMFVDVYYLMMAS
jgi:hypothetical protein